jgi:O-antigen/teichoic acid export membrane protein
MTVLVSALGVRGEMLRAEQRPGRYAALFAARVGGGFLLGALLTAFTGLGAAGPLAGVALAAFLVLAVEAPATLAPARDARPRASLARIQAGYALPLAAVLALDLVLSAGDRFVIAGFLGEAAVGAYAAGYGVADRLIMLLFAWAGMAASPLAARAFDTQGSAAAKAVAGDFSRVLVLITFPAAAGIALVAQPLADVLIAHDFDEPAAAVMPWIAAGALMNGFVVYYFAYAFQLTRKTGAQALATGAAAVLNVALNLMLVPAFGLVGAAWATLAAYALALALFAVVGRRWIALPLPMRDVAKTALACAGMAFAVTRIPAWGEAPELIAKALVGATAYALLILCLDAGGARGWVRRLLARGHPSAAAPRIES